ncbi:hypothetical protein V1477_009818 [Vespula maculifrons]|uniref:Uncharacterized protein n=1 Tax=Vespula maculifrons TaxID=7453 RepID=A0ABD2CB50_VESMC
MLLLSKLKTYFHKLRIFRRYNLDFISIFFVSLSSKSTTKVENLILYLNIKQTYVIVVDHPNYLINRATLIMILFSVKMQLIKSFVLKFEINAKV